MPEVLRLCHKKKPAMQRSPLSTKKIGYVLTLIGALAFLASLLIDCMGRGDRQLGAGQLLGLEIGVVMLLLGLWLIFLSPDRTIDVWRSMAPGLEGLTRLPTSLWVVVGFLIAFVVFFLFPVFLNPERTIFFINRFLPNANPIGADIRAVLGYIQDWFTSNESPYGDAFIAYPPLALVLFAPLLLLGYPAYYYFITFTTLFFYTVSTLFLPLIYTRGKNNSLILFLFALGFFSYGFQFELERGQSNTIAFSLALLGLYLYHAREELRLPGVLLFAIGVHLKIYPLILVVMFVEDRLGWKENAKRIGGILSLNIALLFVLGFQMFAEFLHAVRVGQLHVSTWDGNHALKSYVTYLSSNRLNLFGPSPLAGLLENQGPVELFLLTILGLCLLGMLAFSYFRGRSGLNPYVLVVCTICALVVPSISNDYKLPILIAPMALLWCSETMPVHGWKKVLSILLIVITSVAYWSLHYPPVVKPEFLNRNFPALFILLIAVTVLSFLKPWQPGVQPEDTRDLSKE
jgi:hypothetical protein